MSLSFIQSYTLAANEVLTVSMPQHLEVYRYSVIVYDRGDVYMTTNYGDAVSGSTFGVLFNPVLVTAGARVTPFQFTFDRRGLTPAAETLYFVSPAGSTQNSLTIIFEGEPKI